MAELFAILSGVIVLIGAPFYLIDILKGTTKPARATWFIWSVQGVIACVSQAKLGAHWSLLFAVLNAAGNLLVWLLSLKYGTGGWKKIDVTALTIAAVGLTASLIFKSPLIALIGVIVADFAGLIPTYYKSYYHPESETAVTWAALATSSLLAVFSVGSYKFSLIVYPLYFAVTEYALLGTLLLRRKAAPAGLINKRH